MNLIDLARPAHEVVAKAWPSTMTLGPCFFCCRWRYLRARPAWRILGLEASEWSRWRVCTLSPWHQSVVSQA